MNDVLSREVETLRGLSEEAGQKHSEQLQALRAEMRDMDTKHRREGAETSSQYKVSAVIPIKIIICSDTISAHVRNYK